MFRRPWYPSIDACVLIGVVNEMCLGWMFQSLDNFGYPFHYLPYISAPYKVSSWFSSSTLSSFVVIVCTHIHLLMLACLAVKVSMNSIFFLLLRRPYFLAQPRIKDNLHRNLNFLQKLYLLIYLTLYQGYWALVWPQWWSFADVSQQGLNYSKKKLVKEK